MTLFARTLNSALSAAARVAIIAVAAILGQPASAAAQNQSVTLAWDANPEPAVRGYLIQYGTRSGGYSGTIDVGNRTSWTVNGLLDDYRYYFAVVAYDTDRLVSAPSNEVSTDGVIVQTGGFLADQRPSIVWQHATTGALLTWHLNGATVVETRRPSIPQISDLTWKITGTGDLNGDSYPDMVWRNSVTGGLVVWFMHNEQVLGTHYLSIARVADPTWIVRAVADVNGDGRADLLWQNENSGGLVVWFMDGVNVRQYQYLSVPALADTNWKMAGAGDIDGDRRADIIWQNMATGQIGAWLLNGATVVEWGNFNLNTASDLNWKVRGVKDLNGDGAADLIWHHATSGQLVVWYTNKFRIASWSFLSVGSVSDLNWVMAGPS